MSSNVASEESAWVSGVIRPVSHSSDVRRTRKAEKNRKDRQRKQARRRACLPAAAGTTAAAAAAAAAAIAASRDRDTTPEAEEHRQHQRPELESAAASSSTCISPHHVEEAGKFMIPAADVHDTGEASHDESGAVQAPSAPTADSVAEGVNDRDAVDNQADLPPSKPQPKPQPPQPQPRRSHYVEEGTPEFEEWTRTRATLTMWARKVDVELKIANGQQPSNNHRRYAPPSEQYSWPILTRTAAFAVQCGFDPGVAPQLLQHVVSTVFGEDFASNVVALSSKDVEFMFAVFWTKQVVPLTEAERLFGLAAGFDSGGGMTMDNLRPLIIGAVQHHPEFLLLTAENQARYIENVLATTFSRLGRFGVITLNNLRRSDFAASLNAVSRHEIGLEESIYFSRFVSLTMVQNPGYQQPLSSPHGRGGVGSGTEYGGGLSTCGIGNSNVHWATRPSNVAVGSWQ